MASQAQSSRHLTAARRLLDELNAETDGDGGDPQAKATAAVAHAVLVLAEQVAVARVAMVTDRVQNASAEASARR